MRFPWEAKIGIVNGLIYLKRDLSGDENSIPSNGLLNSEMMVRYLFYLIQFWENKCKILKIQPFVVACYSVSSCGKIVFSTMLTASHLNTKHYNQQSL